MTDAPFSPTDPPNDHADDDVVDVVSAYLDGEASAAERVRVEGDPRLLAEVAALRATVARFQGATLPTPEPTQRRDAIAAALASADGVLPADLTAADAHGTDDAATGGAVVSLAARRSARFPRLLTLAAAAAVVLIVGFVLAGIRGNLVQETEMTASAPSLVTSSTFRADSGSDTGGERAVNGEDPQAPASETDSPGGQALSTPPTVATTTAANPNGGAQSTTTAPPADPVAAAFRGDDLGRVAADDLVAAVTDRAARTAPGVAVDPVTVDQVAACDQAVRTRDGELGALRYAAVAEIDGRQGILLLYDIDVGVGNANGTNRLHATDRVTCAGFLTRTF